MSDGKSASDTDRYGYSMMTDTWYLVHEWEDLGDGKLRAKSKEEVDRSEVPDALLETTVERKDRPLDTETDAEVSQ